MNTKFLRLWATKNKNDEWWSSFITAPLAILFTYVVVEIKWLTPNQITLISFLTAIVSAFFIFVGGQTNFLLAAFLIHLSHVFDCMDGQLARYRQTLTASGSYFDRVTDQIQITIWFGAIGYAAFLQSGDVVPIILSLVGIAFYSLRGYVKYVAIHVEMSRDHRYLETMANLMEATQKPVVAGPEFSFSANFKWFVREQVKILQFDEGVFIFMLSLALVLDQLTPMLWIFAASQVYYGLIRSWQRGCTIDKNQNIPIEK